MDLLLLARTALGTALPQARRRISLARLAEAVLGRGLDKTEQTSAWGARPLRAAQLRYAAADAHCLVALNRELNRRRAGLETHFWVSHFSGERRAGRWLCLGVPGCAWVCRGSACLQAPCARLPGAASQAAARKVGLR